MTVKVRYENKSYQLEKFLSLNIPADAKYLVWREQIVSRKLFSNYQRTKEYQVKILRELEVHEVWNVLKRLASDQWCRNSLDVGLLYDVLMNLKPKTIRTMFASVDVRLGYGSQLYAALNELIIRRKVAAVNCLEDLFRPVDS